MMMVVVVSDVVIDGDMVVVGGNWLVMVMVMWLSLNVVGDGGE